MIAMNLLVSLLLLLCQRQVFCFRYSSTSNIIKNSFSSSSSSSSSLHAVSERTRSFFDKMDLAKNGLASSQAGGAGSASSLIGLERLDESWAKLKRGSWRDKPFQIVYPTSSSEEEQNSSTTSTYDVLVCGGES